MTKPTLEQFVKSMKEKENQDWRQRVKYVLVNVHRVPYAEAEKLVAEIESQTSHDYEKLYNELFS